MDEDIACTLWMSMDKLKEEIVELQSILLEQIAIQKIVLSRWKDE